MHVHQIGVPDPFYVFVNRAHWPARHNVTRTGKLVSAAFLAAVSETAPAGTDARLSRGIQSDIRERFITGTIDYLPFTPNPTHFGWLSPFAVSATAKYRVEYEAEIARRHHFPRAPSRLSAIFAFGDDQSCEQASRLHGWPLDEVRQFRLLPHPLARVSKVNMEIVSLMLLAHGGGTTFNVTDLDEIWRGYWSGADSLELDVLVGEGKSESRSSGCLWEYLIEGALEAI